MIDLRPSAGGKTTTTEKIILAVDPGLKTGICQFSSRDMEIQRSEIVPGGLRGFQEWWAEAHREGPDWDVLVVESFELEEGSHGIEYEAPLAIIHWLKEQDLDIVWQRRMQRGKNTTASVPVLKRAGLYPKRGELKEGHQVAALQHALSYLIRIRHHPTIELLHPKEG